MDQQWANRAESAEAAITQRHLKKLWLLPGTQLGVVAWPAVRRERWFTGVWHYWWQAHVLDCLVDAQLRDPSEARRKQILAQIRGQRLRNLGVVNDYYDDMAWLALAIQRADAVTGKTHRRTLEKLTGQLVDSWVPRTAVASPGANRTSSSTRPPTAPPASSCPASMSGWPAR